MLHNALQDGLIIFTFVFILLNYKIVRNVYGASVRLDDFVKRMDVVESLESELKKFREIFDYINECFLILDKNMTIIDCNKSVESLFGYKKKEVIGKSIYFLIKDTITPGKKIIYFDCKTKSGTEISVEISAVNVDVDKNMTTCVVLRNTTEQREAFKKIDLLNQTLAVRVEALRSFQFTIAHDLNSPIRAIDGFSEILEQDYGEKLDEEGSRLVSKIRMSAKYLTQLIKDIMRLSQLSDGKIEINKNHFNISNVVEKLCKDQEKQFDLPHQITVEPNLFSTSDENLVTILLINLISNAFNFSSKKEKISIMFGKTVNKDKECYYIKDYGVGFDMSQYDKLFKPFSRLHSKKDYNGTGIGLSIVKQIVSLHGGEVWAESVVNEGATFYFTLGEENATL